MTFHHVVCDLDLNDAGLHGMAASRSTLWKRTLEEAKHSLRSFGFSRATLKIANDSVEALREKKKAKDHSMGALNTYRYFAEDRLRAVLSKAYEDLLPFEWVCSWSSMKMQQRMYELNSFLSPILSCSRSRILRNCPVAVVAVIMESIAYGKGIEVDWWLQDQNLHSAHRKALKMMKGFEDEEVSPRDKLKVKASFDIIADTLEHLSSYLADRDMLFFESSAIEMLERSFIVRSDVSSTDEEFVYLTEQECSSMITSVACLNKVVAADFKTSLRTQKALLKRKSPSDLQDVCMLETKDGESVELFSVDALLLDVAYLLSDIIKCTKRITHPSNQAIISDMMKTLAVPWDASPKVHFRKLLTFVIAVGDGIDESNADVSLLVEGISKRLAEDGSFKEERQPRTTINPRDRKRIPINQPRVILVNPSDSDSEDGTVRNKRKRSSTSRNANSHMPVTSNFGTRDSPARRSRKPNRTRAQSTVSIRQVDGSPAKIKSVAASHTESGDICGDDGQSSTQKNTETDARNQMEVTQARDPVQNQYPRNKEVIVASRDRDGREMLPQENANTPLKSTGSVFHHNEAPRSFTPSPQSLPKKHPSKRRKTKLSSSSTDATDKRRSVRQKTATKRFAK